MTLPTITYGVGWQTDCGDRSDWSDDHAHEDGMSATLTVDNGTVFNIAVSSVAGNKSVYYEYDIPTYLGPISSDKYSKFLVRYMTSNTSIRAKIVLVFTSGTQTVMAETSNVNWTIFSETITPGKAIDMIRIYATQAKGNVYFDFISINKGTFSFPDFKRIRINPKPKLAVIAIPSSDTDIIQHLGRANTEIFIDVEMKSGETWGGSKLTYGEYLMQVLYDRYFQWLTTDQGNFKVMPNPSGFEFTQDSDSGKQLLATFAFLEYDEGDASIFIDSAWYGK